jgi:hypothetical protein
MYVLGDPVNRTDRQGLYLDAEDCINDPDACVDEDESGGAANTPGSPCYGNYFVATGQEDCPSDAGDSSAPSPPECDPGWLSANALISGPSGKNGAQKSFTGADVDFAARILFAEASTNADERLAVASVEINRTNGGFGGTTFMATAGGYQAYFDNTEAFTKTDITSGNYQSLNALDCASLANAIKTMVGAIESGPEYDFLYFRRGKRGYGTVIGDQRFWKNPPKPTKSPKPKKPHADISGF